MKCYLCLKVEFVMVIQVSGSRYDKANNKYVEDYDSSKF